MNLKFTMYKNNNLNTSNKNESTKNKNENEKNKTTSEKRVRKKSQTKT